MPKKSSFTRRTFLQTSAAIAAMSTISIVPRKVLGAGQPAPSETFGGALIGCGDRGPSGTWPQIGGWGIRTELRAQCDVKFKDKADNKTFYTDFRRVMERKDIDFVAIATPPHWHALISIAAMQAGKDVLCEKPMTRFVAEGRAVLEAEKRYNRVFQVGTFGRFGRQGEGDSLRRKIITSGLLKNSEGVVIHRGGLKVRGWAGHVNEAPKPVPANLDWDMYCGPSPLRPYTNHRNGGSHRCYWDYDGGGLGDMGQHMFDPLSYAWGLDVQLPVEVEASAPPAHPEITGMWGWAKLKYACGVTLVVESTEWGEGSGMKDRDVTLNDLSPEDQAKIKAMPKLPPLLNFGEAMKQRKPAGGNATAAHYAVCIMHLMNVAIRTGRKLKIDPVTERAIGDDEANYLINQPMRAPWHL